MRQLLPEINRFNPSFRTDFSFVYQHTQKRKITKKGATNYHVAGNIFCNALINQEELACVQAAKNHADMKACRDKFREEMNEKHQNLRK